MLHRQDLIVTLLLEVSDESAILSLCALVRTYSLPTGGFARSSKQKWLRWLQSEIDPSTHAVTHRRTLHVCVRTVAHDSRTECDLFLIRLQFDVLYI